MTGFVFFRPFKSYHNFFFCCCCGVAATNALIDELKDVFDNSIEVRLTGQWWWSLGLTQTLVFLRGLERIMMDMYDFSDEVHSLMKFISDGTMKKVDYLEKNNLLCLNNDGTYVGSGGFGWSDELPCLSSLQFTP